MADIQEIDGRTDVWEVETQWSYTSGLVTLPTLGMNSKAERIRVHAPLGKKIVVFTVMKIGGKPCIPRFEGDSGDQWLEMTEIFGRNVVPTSTGEPQYVIRGAHHYGLANPEEARFQLELGGVPFIREAFQKTISESDYCDF